MVTQNVYNKELLMKTLEIKYVKIHPKAIVPEKIKGNLAFDLHVVRDEMFYPNESGEFIYRLMPDRRKLFSTGLKMSLPLNFGAIIKDRSGLAAKYGIHVLAGVIDSCYRGPWLICLLNTSSETYEIVEGDRIAQAILIKERLLNFIECKALDDTFRGEKGFGSSGK